MRLILLPTSAPTASPSVKSNSNGCGGKCRRILCYFDLTAFRNKVMIYALAFAVAIRNVKKWFQFYTYFFHNCYI